MSSLFARIWLSYWLVMALTLAGAMAVTFVLAMQRAESIDGLSTATFASEAQAALAQNGREGLGNWIVMERHAEPELMFYFVDPGGHELLSRSIRGRPLPHGGNTPPTIVAPQGAVYRMLVRRLPGIDFGLWRITMKPFILLLLAIAASGIGCAWLARHLTRPVVGLRRGVRAIAGGAFDTRMEVSLTERRDELGGLARDFDSMAADLRRMMTAKETLLRDVSHELRSPLARLRVAAGLARKGAPRDIGGQFDRIDREVERIDWMIGQILRLSRVTNSQGLEKEEVDLTALLEEVAQDARLESAGRHHIDLEISSHLCLEADPKLVRSAVENVVRNALHFTSAGANISIAAAAQPGAVIITIADNGPGVPEDALGLLFEPYFRGTGSAGAGLGLAIAAQVIRAHEGEMEARSGPAGGLLVQIRLPANVKAQ